MVADGLIGCVDTISARTQGFSWCLTVLNGGRWTFVAFDAANER